MRPAGTKEILIEQDGKKVACTGIYKDGHNYIMLADLDKPLGYATVTWDAAKKVPIVKSKEVPK